MSEPVPAQFGSETVDNEVLDIFSIPPTDTSIHSYRIATINPTSNSITPIEFDIPGGREHIDLTRSYFRMELSLKKTDDGNIVDGDQVWLASNAFHTIIKQTSIYVNGTLVSEQTDTYAYKAYLETILNHGNEASETYLARQGFYHALDHPPLLTAKNVDIAGNHAHWQALNSENQKAIKRANGLKNKLEDGKKLILIGKLHADIFNVKRLFIPGLDLKMRFTLNDPKFFMNGVGAEVRLKPEDLKMTFHACMVPIRSDKYTEIAEQRTMRRKSVFYPTVRSEIRVFSIPANTRFFEATDVFIGRVPDRTVVGLVHGDAFNGVYERNPFSFQKFGISRIKQTIENVKYPYETLELNHNNGEMDMDGYHRLVMAGCLDNFQRCMIGPEHWGHQKNTTLFMWDNMASGCAEDMAFNPRQDGKLNITFHLGANVNHIINVIVYGEFENMMEINPTGGVEYDIYKQQVVGGRLM